MAVIVFEAPTEAGPQVRQFTRAGVAAVWAAAAVPMGLLAWVVVPAVAGAGASPRRFFMTLTCALTAGLIWQFLVALAVVWREQRSLRWATLRSALWLESLTAEGKDGGERRGGRLWLWLIPFVLAFAQVVSHQRADHADAAHDQDILRPLALCDRRGQVTLENGGVLPFAGVLQRVCRHELGHGVHLDREVVGSARPDLGEELPGTAPEQQGAGVEQFAKAERVPGDRRPVLPRRTGGTRPARRGPACPGPRPPR
jgi:hypothetical protein